MITSLFVLLLATLLSAVTVYMLRRYFAIRHRADEGTSHHIDVAFKKWNALLDAKLANDADVPDAIIELGQFMVDNILSRSTPALLLAVLAERSKGGAPATQEDSLGVETMREPLQRAFHDLSQSWVICVSNRNLVIRALIRQMLGRMAVREHYRDPFSVQVISNTTRRAQISDGAAA